MTVDPKITFWIGLVATIAKLLSAGSVWANAIPAEWIPAVTAWSNIIGIVGLAVMTVLTGVSGSQTGPIVKYFRNR